MVKEVDYNAIAKWVADKICQDNAMDEYTKAELDEIATYSEYLVQSVNQKKVVKKKLVILDISKEVQKQFEVFWQAYPGISRFEYMGKKFEGERVLKANKQICLKLYNDAISDIIMHHYYAKHDMINAASKVLLQAMQVQVETIKQESYKTGVNKLQYLKACEVFLRQKAYEGWIGQPMPERLVQKEEVPTDYSINI